MRNRIQNLKNEIVNATLSVSARRAEILTRAYRESEGQAIEQVRAHAIGKVLRELPVWISPDEWIVGHPTEYWRAAPIFPEMHISWLEEEIESLDRREYHPFYISEETKQTLYDIMPFWKGKTLCDAAYSRYPEEVIIAREKAGLISSEQNERGGVGNFLIEYPLVLREGLMGMKADMAARKAALDPIHPETPDKRRFYDAAMSLCDSAVAFASRYADLAEELAENEPDATRKAELLHMAEVCRRVPAHPARDLHEALQSMWFIYLICHIETNGTSVSFGRIDRYLLPYYQAMVDAGREEDATELLECFMVKLNEIVRIYDEKSAVINAGLPSFPNMTIGGLDEHGKDATTVLSYKLLDCLMDVRLPQIHIVLKVHRLTPPDLLRKAIRSVKTVQGMPAFIGNTSLEKFFLTHGATLKEARESAITGCVIPGLYGVWSRGSAVYVNILKAVELAMNRGFDPLSGEQAGPVTADPAEFTSMDDFYAAFCIQFESILRHAVTACNILDGALVDKMPHIFASMFVRGCIERGKDGTRGGANYNFTRIMAVGLPNTADSFAAMEKVVFVDKRITMAQLAAAIRDNFQSPENQRIRMWLDQAPKYGNDDDFVDKYAVKIADWFFDAIEPFRNPRGGCFIGAFQTLLANLAFGRRTGPTPDGRVSMDTMADTLSPAHGKDRTGPTAVCASCGKIDHNRTSGTILNLKINDTVLSTEADEMLLADLISTYLVDLEGTHVQFNIIDNEKLRDAQKHPEKYRDLIVRVSGYSAYFTELSPQVQQDIIDRSEHRF